MSHRWSQLPSLLLALASATAGGAEAPVGIEWLGEAEIDRSVGDSQVPVGGLSGLVYDAASDRYFAISDDRGEHGPVRIYRLRIEMPAGRLTAGGAVAEATIELRRAGGLAFVRGTIDPEGLALDPSGHWIVASEGRADEGVPAALFEFTAGGDWVRALRLPRAFKPRRRAGVRDNLALESATISPDGEWLFSGTESALRQDGVEATPGAGSSSRLLKFELGHRRPRAVFFYPVEPIAVAPKGDRFAVNGLVELLALDGDRLLALERSYTAGVGNTVRLFLIDSRLATDVSGMRRPLERAGVLPVSKRLLLDLATLGIEPDNVEGMAFGPPLADGRRRLILVADDNFSPGAQRNQVLALAIEPGLLADLESPP